MASYSSSLRAIAAAIVSGSGTDKIFSHLGGRVMVVKILTEAAKKMDEDESDKKA